MTDDRPPGDDRPPDDGWRPPGWEEEPDAEPSGGPAGWEQQPAAASGWDRTSGATAWGEPQPPGAPWPPPPGYGYTRRTEGSAVAVLVLGILSWVLIGCGGAILGGVALALIPNARRKISASGGMLEGDGYLTAGKWLSITSLGFTVLGIGLVVVLVILGAVFDSGTQNEFQMLLSALP